MKKYIAPTKCFKLIVIFLMSCQTPKELPIEKSRIYEQEMTSIEGRTFKGRELGAKVVLVNFWASWCAPCMEELPSLIELKKTYSEIQIVAINTEQNDQLKKIMKVKDKLNISDELIIVADKETKIADSINVSAIPVTFIYSNHRLVDFIDGPMVFNSPSFKKKMEILLER